MASNGIQWYPMVSSVQCLLKLSLVFTGGDDCPSNLGPGQELEIRNCEPLSLRLLLSRALIDRGS